METVVNGVRLFYTVQGTGSPVILLHGNGETHEIFDRVIPTLSREHQVFAVDSRCHGRSEDPKEISYEAMAEDMIALITWLGIQKPLFYGFSDGGIVGLLIAMKEPELLGKLVISGANLNPRGLKWPVRAQMRLSYWLKKDKLTKLMLTQSDIRPESLRNITTAVTVLAGQHDVIRPAHTRLIADSIPGSELRILPGEGHGSYIVHSEKLYPILKELL